MIRRAEVREHKIQYNGNISMLADLQTEEVYTYANQNSHKYVSDIDTVNEIYLKFVLPAMAVEKYIKQNNISNIKVCNTEEIETAIVSDAARRVNITCTRSSRCKKSINRIVNIFQITGSACYLLIKQLQTKWNKKSHPSEQNFAVIRTPAARKKFSQMNDIFILYENYEEEQSLYRYLKKGARCRMVLKALIRAWKELGRYEKYLINRNMPDCGIVALKYYGMRIVHTLFYRYAIEALFSLGWEGTFYTGNNLDRFAINEEAAAQKYGIKTSCVPHGLEYGFKLPHCFVGDVFYATSLKASQWLNDLYHTKKFIYDKAIVKKMYSLGYSGGEKKIVFLTEPREVYVNLNIIKKLLIELSKYKMTLYLKLHPKDKKEDYKEFEGKITFIQDMKEALCGNICISRKSTTLLEALYNESDSAAIITTAKDKCEFKTFISLQDENIKVFEEIEPLAEWIWKKSKGEGQI